MNKFLALIAALAALAFAAAGCGSDDDDGTTEVTASLTKAQFVKQGNAICAAGNKEINAEFDKFAEEHNLSGNKPPSEEDLEEAAEEFLLPSISRQVEEVRALGAPEGEEEEVDAFVEEAEAEIEEFEDDPSKVTDEDSFEDVNRTARELGLTVCGEE